MMPDPVKTTVLKVIAQEMEDHISQINKVHPNPSKPIDLDIEKPPIAFLFDEREGIKNRNRINIGTFSLQVEVWIEDGEVSISDQADIIQAEIHKLFTSSELIKAATLFIKEDEEFHAEKFYANENLGGIFLRYQVQYAFAYGDPYNPVRI